jgi:hypothetical protein
VKEREDDEEEKLPLVPTRRMSTHAVNRVYRERNKTRNRASQRRKGIVEEDDSDSNDNEEDERLVGRQGVDSVTANHHYTFNMLGVPANRSEVPYMLLGCVFMQILIENEGNTDFLELYQICPISVQSISRTCLFISNNTRYHDRSA